MPFVIDSLPYAFGVFETRIGTKTMEIHHNQHHVSFVAKLYAALEQVGT